MSGQYDNPQDYSTVNDLSLESSTAGALQARLVQEDGVHDAVKLIHGRMEQAGVPVTDALLPLRQASPDSISAEEQLGRQAKACYASDSVKPDSARDGDSASSQVNHSVKQDSTTRLFFHAEPTYVVHSLLSVMQLIEPHHSVPKHVVIPHQFSKRNASCSAWPCRHFFSSIGHSVHLPSKPGALVFIAVGQSPEQSVLTLHS